MALLKTYDRTSTRYRTRAKCWPWLAVLTALLLGGLSALAAPVVSREYQLKAVFLFNFAQFVDWPRQAFPSAETPLVIGVLGDDPFGSTLDETVLGELVGQRPMVVRRYQRVEDIELCHMVFISRSESEKLGQIMAALNGRSILTVSDADGFTKQGGMIRFISEKNKIRLKINLEAAKSCGLTISSKLLRPAEIVTAKTN